MENRDAHRAKPYCQQEQHSQHEPRSAPERLFCRLGNAECSEECGREGFKKSHVLMVRAADAVKIDENQASNDENQASDKTDSG